MDINGGVIVYVSPKNLEKILKGENILIRKNEESDNNVFYYPKGYEKSYKKIYGESYNLEKIVGLSVKVEQDLYTTI
ncbi:hypothetical protein MJ1_0542 [Nanobdella aerobiophila]|uniref:Uncharacterized protein n=1 Tax=Nanobdella aerobiophila TaxID=2586965 RepID=A0A915SYB8_9ARCH|nr:hypothetical protein [Nanobdella aerobiophila]BBL45695.1 hypothetical protein MJ1_0542 [Nanobdella aerobiophila]